MELEKNSQNFISNQNLTPDEHQFVQLIVRGIKPERAATEIGQRPEYAYVLLSEPYVQQAIKQIREFFDPELYKSKIKIDFTKDDATMLYMEAHRKAANSTEEIKAIDSMVKLHGLAEPEKRELKVTNIKQLRSMSDAQLQRMAEGEDIIEGDWEEID